MPVRELHYLQAAGNLARGVGEDLAVLGGDDGGEFLGVRLQQLRKRNMTRARASGVAAAHSGRAAVAARTAASTSAREPSATLRATAPVAGLNTSPNRPPPLIRCPPITCCTI